MNLCRPRCHASVVEDASTSLPVLGPKPKPKISKPKPQALNTEFSRPESRSASSFWHTPHDELSQEQDRSGLFSKLWAFLVMDYIAAPNISGYPNGTLILGTTHMIGTQNYGPYLA